MRNLVNLLNVWNRLKPHCICVRTMRIQKHKISKFKYAHIHPFTPTNGVIDMTMNTIIIGYRQLQQLTQNLYNPIDVTCICDYHIFVFERKRILWSIFEKKNVYKMKFIQLIWMYHVVVWHMVKTSKIIII